MVDCRALQDLLARVARLGNGQNLTPFSPSGFSALSWACHTSCIAQNLAQDDREKHGNKETHSQRR